MHAGWWLWSVVFSLAGLVGGEVDIQGEISFDLKYPEKRAQGETSVTRSEAVLEAVSVSGVEAEAMEEMTQAAPVECVYQYPETPQVNAMLSNMMNQLTKMFVRVNKYLRTDSRREDDKRFKVVQDSSADFFDNIYFNMTEEYRRFVNHTRSRVKLAERGDPCDHQAEIRDVWRTLLDSSRESVRRAALACVEEYLRVYRAEDSELRGRARSRASQLLRRELARVRHDQLSLLCDKFQLCYNELL